MMKCSKPNIGIQTLLSLVVEIGRLNAYGPLNLFMTGSDHHPLNISETIRLLFQRTLHLVPHLRFEFAEKFHHSLFDIVSD